MVIRVMEWMPVLQLSNTSRVSLSDSIQIVSMLLSLSLTGQSFISLINQYVFHTLALLKC